MRLIGQKQSSRDVLTNFKKFAGKHLCQGLCFNKVLGKHLCQGLFFNKVAGPSPLLKKRLWYRYFPLNFVKFLRTPFFAEHFWTTASDPSISLMTDYLGKHNQSTKKVKNKNTRLERWVRSKLALKK